MIPLLIPLVTTLAPQLVDWLFGAKAEAVASQVAGAVQQVTGFDPASPNGMAAARAALQGKPDLAAQLQIQLLTIRAGMQAEADAAAATARRAELEELATRLADTAGARGQTMTLAGQNSAIAWGSPVLSAIVLGTFGAMLGTVLSRAVPPGSEALANVMLGTLAAMATQVANYWLGSSAGSRGKDDTIAAAQTALAKSTPAK